MTAEASSPPGRSVLTALSRLDAIAIPRWLAAALLAALIVVTAAYFPMRYSAASGPGAAKVAQFLGSPAAATGGPQDQLLAAFDQLSGSRFLTDAPDGQAFIGIEFDQPVLPKRARLQAQPGQWDSYMATGAVMETSDDGVAWRERGAFARAGREVLVWRGGNGSPSRFWRARITESGDEPEVSIAEFSIVEGSHVVPPDGGLAALLFVTLALATRVLSGRFRWALAAFFTVAACVLVRWNSLLFFSTEFWAVYSRDTRGYLEWAAKRPPGVGFILNILNFTGDFRPSIVVQTNLMLASVIFLFAAVGRCLAGFWLPTVSLLAIGAGRALGDFPLVLVSEALFIAFISTMLGGALMAITAARGRAALAWWLVAGLALAASMSIKPLAPALAVAILWSALLVKRRRLGAVVLGFGPGAAAYLVLCAATLVRHGSFSLSAVGPLALAAHVAWWIEPDPAAERSQMLAEISELVDQRTSDWPPDPSWPFEVARLQAQYYNAVAYRDVSQALTNEVERTGEARSSAKTDELLKSVAAAGLTQCPQCFAANVVAHYLTLWSYVPRLTGPLRNSMTRGWNYIERTSLPGLAPDEVRAMDYDLDAMNRARSIASQLRVPFEGLYVVPAALTRIAVWPVLVVSLIATALGVAGFFRKREYSPAVLALIVVALTLNAFFGAQALAQPALLRYAVTPYAWFWAMLCLTCGLSVGAAQHAVGGLIRERSKGR